MKISVGILLYRIVNHLPEVLLVHPGGPFWKNKDEGAWTIPKGELIPGEDAIDGAKREFFEETGKLLSGTFQELSPIRQKGGKLIRAWAHRGNLDEKNILSNMFEMEWPPKSGSLKRFPEVDEAGWFDMIVAKNKINPAQVNFLLQLSEIISP